VAINALGELMHWMAVVPQRKLKAVVVSAVAIALCTACASSVAPTYGTVTGMVAPCVGVVRQGQIKVAVYARQGGHIIASTRVRLVGFPGARYRLRVPPGSYTIAAPKSGVPAEHLSVQAGASVTADFAISCK
jgi:hypothetical protein